MGIRTQILVKGIVQGVGFRPYIYGLAKRRDLFGQVLNNENGVLIDVEGEPDAIKHFISDIGLKPPPLSSVDSVHSNLLDSPAWYDDFQIVTSSMVQSNFVPVSADFGVCGDCLVELFDPRDRRFRYPFINCTNCGPRFTIIKAVPYDRERTTMRRFEMCGACRSEYEDPQNRRFHAEAIACANCGPRLFMASASGNKLVSDDAIRLAQSFLNGGKIVAIKGLGGFHLACNAMDADAVARLRHRKFREDKPFALMAGSLKIIKQHCSVSPAEERLLESKEKPIVLLDKRRECDVPKMVAPGVRTLGFMLPYTPLHALLLDGIDTPLVMTSGNISDEPICYQDKEAADRLNRIADYYLCHDRAIHIRTDDSVVRVPKLSVNPTPVVLRRSRGYAPTPLMTGQRFARHILACGAELKSTFCLARDEYAFISHHIGDLENLETLRSYVDGIEHFKHLYDLRPEVIAYDLHPEYLSTKYALDQDGIDRVGVQHHHAHIASCLADNEAVGEVIGVAMDGLGFGCDGKFWGGEFFIADLTHAERIAHLDYIPLPGGAKAISEPWRLAAVYLERAFGESFSTLQIPFVDEMDVAKWSTLNKMVRSSTNSPDTSSMGRLFDAVSALLCIRRAVNYEGQAAIELEAIADRTISGRYEFEIDEQGVIRAESLIRQLVGDLLDGRSNAEVSAKFHHAVAGMIGDVAISARTRTRLNRVALSGGVFQNMFLLGAATRLLSRRGFEVLTHSRVPTNDGGISLGQAVIANAKIQNGSL